MNPKEPPKFRAVDQVQEQRRKRAEWLESLRRAARRK